MNERQGKPRTRGITEIRGPYYTVMGKRYLEDVLETMGEYVDSLKFAAGSFSLMRRDVLKEIIETAHRYNVLVSTGGWMEYVLTQGPTAVEQYIKECKEVGFDIIELSSGFITFPIDDWIQLIDQVKNREDAEIVTVTLENRNKIIQTIKEAAIEFLRLSVNT